MSSGVTSLVGGLLSFGVAEAIGTVQQFYYGESQVAWSRKAYNLDLHSLKIASTAIQIDVLNTLREELRDQVAVIISSLDTLMVVGTLMLSIGFGFVVEGTFPNPIADHSLEQRPLLIAYSVLAAFSLIFPFWSLVFTLRVRYEVDDMLSDNMEDLQIFLKGIICNSAESFEPMQPWQDCTTPRMMKLRTALNSWLEVVANAVKRKDRTQLQKKGSLSLPSSFSSVAESDNATYAFDHLSLILRIGQKELLKQVTYYHFYYPMAQFFLWIGMTCALLVCCILLGLYFSDTFPSTPWMWRSYTGIVFVNAFASFGFVLVVLINVIRESREKNSQRRGATKDLTESANLPSERQLESGMPSRRAVGTQTRALSDEIRHRIPLVTGTRDSPIQPSSPRSSPRSLVELSLGLNVEHFSMVTPCHSLCSRTDFESCSSRSVSPGPCPQERAPEHRGGLSPRHVPIPCFSSISRCSAFTGPVGGEDVSTEAFSAVCAGVIAEES